jgi:hypothetical protein
MAHEDTPMALERDRHDALCLHGRTWYMRICADQPQSVRASVFHVPSFAKLLACTEKQVREAFEEFGGLQPS